MQWDYEGQITILLLKLHNSKWGACQCRNMERQTTGVLYLFTASNSDSFLCRTSVLNCFCKRNFLTQSLSSYTIRQERHFLKQILCYALQIKGILLLRKSQNRLTNSDTREQQTGKSHPTLTKPLSFLSWCILTATGHVPSLQVPYMDNAAPHQESVW